MISIVIYDALTRGEVACLPIAADYIEEYKSGHPEAGVYCQRLRDVKNVRVQTLIDTILKFGNRRERKEMSRMVRLALRRRKSTMQSEFSQKINLSWNLRDRTLPAGIKSMEARQKLNRLLGNIIPEPQREDRYRVLQKGAVIATAKKQRAFRDDVHTTLWWFLSVLKQLIECVRSSEPIS